ncbi:MAG: hypothetical protein XD51_0137 [Moorella sp. 60_41]|nr:MAG: hypothetical protein XD51_0137 [Moorella sp. 60_41]
MPVYHKSRLRRLQEPTGFSFGKEVGTLLIASCLDNCQFYPIPKGL